MVAFHVGEDMHGVFEVGKQAEALINSKLKAPMELELENVYMPFMLFAKKTYCAVKWTKPDAPDGIIYKGLKVVRRDTCELVRQVSREVIHKLLVERDSNGAIESVRHAVRRLLRGEVDMADLQLSKALKRLEDYKMTKQPHLHVAELMDQRMPGSAPRPGMATYEGHCVIRSLSLILRCKNSAQASYAASWACQS